ncbi:hypothetical protein vBRpoPV13_52 [Ruegeria phage vB_RpoP-V13]|uniref:Uncharacterized protein n=1 Tax=Ruegeria phage vB_RpoP-V13 TaxID=2218612 RepID=A0A2Z4QHD9_9CAUD|nr:hypothetical protein HYP63_gp52 [Ruegeria phage vB_RpoP-V13]AWY09409.1 hypothetical protein vBRpoPV13_52 [Ruegeria phage vB_RpoP-V13]
MLSKFFGALAGTIAVLVVLALIAIVGVAVMFIGYFLLWGFIGIFFVFVIWFLISSAIEEFKSPHDPDDPGP